LRERYGVDAICIGEHRSDPDVITEARNVSLERNHCDWILVLDADEQISVSDLRVLEQLTAEPGDAFFLTWRNTYPGGVFNDYKLSFFRNGLGIRFDGMVHSNPQVSLRRQGLEATLVPGVVIHHSLENRNGFREARKKRLQRYVSEDPSWWRYQWFLGYTYFKENDFEQAVPLLRDTCNSLSLEFPVECLNAHFVLTDINARKGIHDKCFRIMRQASSFYEQVKDDFEVRANLEMGSWIADTVRLIDRNELEGINSYEFAY
jgi:hypothetical protein